MFWYDGEYFVSQKFEDLEIEDRVGGGDGFCSGLVFGFLNDFADPQEIVEFGAAHGALLQTTRGDTSVITVDEVRDAMGGGSARIKR